MSLLLTRNCHYAILVAIEDGQHFIPRDDKDIYITSRLNLTLPRPVDDLIPPTTLLSTKPTILLDKPQWRTTLVYYISSQILHRLRKRQSQITLEVITLPEKGSRESIGSMILQMDHAKMVLMKNGKRDISQIQQFVVDKGDWLSISENSRSKVKAGLFIVEMPNNTNTADKEVGTPLQMPIKTNYYSNNDSNSTDLGLEICSDVSELFIENNSTTDSNKDDLLFDDNEDEEDYEQDMMNRQLNEEEENGGENRFITIGDGQDQYSFLFRIFEAKHIAAITKKFPRDVTACFQYEFADKQFLCAAEYDQDRWEAIEYVESFMLKGHLKDIKEWLTKQKLITVCLLIEDSEGNQEIIGFSEVYLKGRDIGIKDQLSMIYDCERIWHVNTDKQFSQLQLQVGLERGWEELDDYIEKEE